MNELLTRPELLRQWGADICPEGAVTVTIPAGMMRALVIDAQAAHELHALVNNPQTADFLEAVRAEAAHQVQRWGEAHDRNKSAENWFWLVGYLSGKCLRACIDGDKAKALHHTISSAAALCNWWKAIQADTTGAGIGADDDIKPAAGEPFGCGESLETSEREGA
ncbi:MAG: hypothetical protein KIS62_12360 [Ramlibacter sp.]|nr:hypothetical protein [Ramlibacter sp.]MCW5650531.1 hypothetical protein [Ramlibacter sp.]